MKILKQIAKGFLVTLLIPILYFLIALLSSLISIGEKDSEIEKKHKAYLHTNGVHMDILLAKENMTDELLEGLNEKPGDQYFSFGWGDKDFYLNTPNWEDLKFSTAFSAMFLASETLIHVSRYRGKLRGCVEVPLSAEQLAQLNDFLLNSFELDEQGKKSILPNKGYAHYDDFFQAKGAYSCLKTCNSWVNDALKSCGATACLWTPFDWALMDLYEK